MKKNIILLFTIGVVLFGYGKLEKSAASVVNIHDTYFVIPYYFIGQLLVAFSVLLYFLRWVITRKK